MSGTQHNPAVAYGALLAAAALWGSNPVAARLIGAAIPPITLSWLRWLVVLCVLLPFIWRDRHAIGGAPARGAGLSGGWLIRARPALQPTGPQTPLVYKGLETTTAVNVGLLNSTIP